MQASSTEPQARHPGYLASCPTCHALNGINAAACWRCEQALPVADDETGAPPGGAKAATPGAATGRPDESPPAGTAADGGPHSFFPVLRDEVDAQAANDGHAPDASLAGAGADEAATAAPPAAPADTWPRWATGAALLAVAAAVGVALWMLTPRGVTDPTRAAPLLTTGSRAPTSLSLPSRESVGVSSSTALPISPTALSATSAATSADAPPPPPVNAACTPQVVALGLCAPASR